MALYKLTRGNTALRSSDNAFVPYAHPDYVAWIAAGNTPDPADPLPADPFKFDLGDDDPNPDPSQAASAIANLRSYLGVSSPTLPQTAAAMKILIRVVLFVLRRVGV